MNNRTVPALLALGLIAVGCDGPTPAEPVAVIDVPAPSFAVSARVVHHVSVGGNDFCEALGQKPGCDANFSLTAIERADGSVRGQYQDTFDGGGRGIHVAVDCLKIEGNAAVVGGVITKGLDTGVYVEGNRVWTVVVDNGTSAGSTPDQISFSYYAGGNTCAVANPALFPLFDLKKGQVTIR
jgi:hypothetical protein